MDGRRIAMNLSVYHSKYWEQLLNSSNHSDDKSNGGPDCSKTKRVEPPTDTDGKFVEIHLLNDYTGTKTKEELQIYETEHRLPEIRVCPAVHGGALENPKVVTASIGNVLEKWEFCYQQLQRKIKAQNPVNEPKKEKLLALYRCTSMENLTVRAQEEDLGENNEHPVDVPGFIATIRECSEKVYLYALDLSRHLLEKGEVRQLSVVLASVCLTRNRVQVYNDQFSEEGKKKTYGKELKDYADMIEGLTVQVLQYHNTLMHSVVLTHPESTDWSNSLPFFEGERISVPVQFWWFYLQGIRSDLFNIVPPSIGRRILGKVFNESLGILTVRYCQTTPGLRRLAQYRADIVSILYISLDILMSIVGSLHDLLSPLPKFPTSRSIHAKCTMLVAALTMVGCPIKTLGRSIEEPNIPNRLEPIEKTQEERLTQWLHLVAPNIFGTNPAKMSDSSFIYVLGRTSALQPQPDWALVVRLCLSRGHEFPALIMKNFGAFIPGLKGETPKISMRGGCGHLMCSKRCLNAADLLWPQAVGSGVLYIVMHGNPEKDALVKVMEPLLKKLSMASWEVLNVTVMWNVKRPIWFQALVDLLEPFFLPLIDDLIDDVEAGRTWTLSHVPEAIAKLQTNILDVAYLIPASFYQACELIETLLPDDIRPVCDSVVAHIFISCIYGLINKLIPVFRDWKMQCEKLDFLVAVGEKLCHLEATPVMQKLEGLTDASANAKTEQQHKWDGAPEEFVDVIAKMVSENLLCDPDGQEALKAVHRFVSYNSEWLQKAVGVTFKADLEDEKAAAPKINPWQENVFRVPTPFEMVSQIHQVPFRSLLDHSMPWEECVQSLKRDSNPATLVKLLHRRPENTEDADEGDRMAYGNVMQHFENHLKEKLAAVER